VVIIAIDKIRPLPEVEAVENMVAQTYNGWLGGGTPPVVTFMKEISIFPAEVAVCASIITGDTTRCS
jgi:hypothetical protein